MKKSLLLITLSISLILFSVPRALGQVDKMRTTSFSFKHKSEYGWSDWEDWEETSILITIDREKERITIYSAEKQVFDIAENGGEEYDVDGDLTYSFLCIDQDGLTCQVRFLILYSKNNQKQLYIDYSDVKLVYNVYALD